MENFTIYDGLVLTIVAMIVVFVVLSAIWGIVELVAKIIAYFENQVRIDSASINVPPTNMIEDSKNKKVAEIMALVLASENQPHKKFEIVESKRTK